jgi:hypothetical protein
MRAPSLFPSKRRVARLDTPEPEQHDRTEVLLSACEVGLCVMDREISHAGCGERQGMKNLVEMKQAA